MVGRPDHLEQLSRSVVLRGAGDLLRPDDHAREGSRGFSTGHGEVSRRSDRKEQGWFVSNRGGPGDAGNAVAVVAVSGGIRSDSLWPGNLVVPHAAYDDERCGGAGKWPEGSGWRHYRRAFCAGATKGATALRRP